MSAVSTPPEPAAWIEPALVVHVPPAGLEAAAGAVAAMVPEQVSATGLSGVLECGDGEALSYAADDIGVRIAVGEVALTPGDGRLDLHMSLTLWSEPSALALAGACAGFNLDDTCSLQLQPTPLDAEVALTLAVDPDDGLLHADVLSLDLSTGSFGNPLDTGCLLGDALEVFGAWGVDPITDLLSQVLAEEEAALAEELQASLDEALAGLSLGPYAFDLNGAALDVELRLSSAVVSPEGLILDLAARAQASAVAPCAGDPAAFAVPAATAPTLSGVIPGTALGYHAAAAVRKGFLDQLAHALWQGGGLCLDLGALSGLDLTTDLLALFMPSLSDLWGAAGTPASLVLGARAAPSVRFPGGPAIALDLAGLDLSVHALVQDRQARLAGLELSGQAGVDLALPGDGTLKALLDFDLATDLHSEVVYAELVGEDEAAALAASLPALAGSALDPATLLPSFALPEIYGMSLASLKAEPADDAGEWLGLFVDLGGEPSPLEIPAMDLSGVGCDGGDVALPGCETGCDAGAGCDDAACSGDACEGGTCAVPGAGGRARGAGSALGRGTAVLALLAAFALRRKEGVSLPGGAVRRVRPGVPDGNCGRGAG